MGIEKIYLSDFRNFRKKRLSFSDHVTVILGPNASGKTNILEAIYLLSAGKSFRARIEEEMVKHSEEISRVEGLAGSGRGGRVRDSGTQTLKLEVVLTRGKIKVGEDPEKFKRVARKKLMVNGVARRLFNFAGNLKVVLFAPHDLDLVTETPRIRRKFLDFVLSQVDGEYRRAILSYEKGLRQRNRLLFRIREEGLSRPQLLFWDRLLIKNGDYITKKRGEFIGFVNERPDFDGQDYSLKYDRSAISEARLKQYAREEVASATTLVGPHRDDFCFRLKKNKRARDLAKYGSRGEQRMGVLWLKLAELAFIERVAEERPTLLLDDIFSELDHEHRDIVMDAIGNQQTIITTADPHYIENVGEVEKIRLKG